MHAESERYTPADLIYLMSRLREPTKGCPWDLEQNYLSITSSTLEEVYEVVDAIERKNLSDLKEELGDLLFQIVFYAQLADEDRAFCFDDIVHALTEKLIRRHPHVFPSGGLYSKVAPTDEIDTHTVSKNWERIKQNERDNKGLSGVLDDVPAALPSLQRAQKLQKRASKVGMDWKNIEAVFDKLHEEIDELKDALKNGIEQDIFEEMGDVLFTSVNVARHANIDADQSLRAANKKFIARTHKVETLLCANNLTWADCGIEQLNAFWLEAKSCQRDRDADETL